MPSAGTDGTNDGGFSVHYTKRADGAKQYTILVQIPPVKVRVRVRVRVYPTKTKQKKFRVRVKVTVRFRVSERPITPFTDHSQYFEC